jgi:hypothetical protein
MKIALSAALIAASIALTGCSLLPALPSPASTTDTPVDETPAAETPSDSTPFVYTDEAAGFSITFPGEPTIQPIAGNENGAQRASYSTTVPETDPDGVFYVAGGTTDTETDIDAEQLEGILFRLLNSGASDLAYDPVELDGVSGYQGDVTWSDGKPASVVAIGEGHTYYLLIVIGGAADQHQAFFDSFERLD